MDAGVAQPVPPSPEMDRDLSATPDWESSTVLLVLSQEIVADTSRVTYAAAMLPLETQ